MRVVFRIAMAGSALAALAACGGSSDPVSVSPTTEATTEQATAPATTEAPRGTIPGNGTFEVGVDVQPGKYKNDGGEEDGDTCIAFTSDQPQGGTGYKGAHQSVSTGPGIIEIKAGEYFLTQSCQDWVKQ